MALTPGTNGSGELPQSQKEQRSHTDRNFGYGKRNMLASRPHIAFNRAPGRAPLGLILPAGMATRAMRQLPNGKACIRSVLADGQPVPASAPSACSEFGREIRGPTCLDCARHKRRKRQHHHRRAALERATRQSVSRNQAPQGCSRGFACHH